MFCNCIKNKTKHEQGAWITMSKEKALVKKRPALQIRGVQGTGSMLDGLGTKGATPIRGTAPGVTWRRKKEKSHFRERKSL